MTIFNKQILPGNQENPEGRGPSGDANVQQNHQEIVKIIVPKQFKDDMRALCNHAEVEQFTPGTVIRMSLQEILEIIPKTRKRMDSYRPLIAFLKEEMNVTLELSSRKNKTA